MLGFERKDGKKSGWYIAVKGKMLGLRRQITDDDIC
jgi:hypothetical protein